jgi:hypothetical protein
MTAEPDLLTVTDVMERLRLGRHTVYDLIRSRRLHPRPDRTLPPHPQWIPALQRKHEAICHIADVRYIRRPMCARLRRTAWLGGRTFYCRQRD